MKLAFWKDQLSERYGLGVGNWDGLIEDIESVMEQYAEKMQKLQNKVCADRYKKAELHSVLKGVPLNPVNYEFVILHSPLATEEKK